MKDYNHRIFVFCKTKNKKELPGLKPIITYFTIFYSLLVFFTRASGILIFLCNFLKNYI